MANTQTSIKDLLNATEGEHYQFKEAKNRFSFNDAAQCCCALANCGEGKLVFGITDKRPRQVVGSMAFAQPERTRVGLIDKLGMFQNHRNPAKNTKKSKRERTKPSQFTSAFSKYI